jgi:lambda repressor-like predicted transcriptional regulator
MNKKWVMLLGAVVAVSLVGSFVVGVALAQGQTPPTATPTAPQKVMPQGKWGFRGHGMGGPVAGIGALGGMDEIAKLLNMTPDQIWAERVLGKTIADLAKEKGVDTQKLVDALVASQKAMLDQMVTNGRLTQAQADKWLDWYKQLAALQLTEPYVGGFGGGREFGGMRGFGGMHGRGDGGRTAPKSPTPTP